MKEHQTIRYDVNRLFAVFQGFLSGWAPKNYCQLHTTSDSAYDPGSSDYSFCKQYNSLDGRGGTYRPGNVLDMWFVRNEASYFASLFFDREAQQIIYRLVALASGALQPSRESANRLRETQSEADSVVDSGNVPFGEDYVATAKRVTDWLRHQVEARSPQAP